MSTDTLRNVKRGSTNLDSIARNTEELLKESRTTLKQFTGQYTDNNGPEIATKVGEIGLVAVPKTSNQIPEPGAVMMGLMGVGMIARRRGRR